MVGRMPDRHPANPGGRAAGPEKRGAEAADIMSSARGGGPGRPGGEMAILTERDRTAVRGELAKLAGPVKLIVFSTQLDASEYCVETERLVREVAECSDQVTVEILNLHIDRERAEAYG